jgi:predicted Ser/Thr protein kinase
MTDRNHQVTSRDGSAGEPSELQTVTQGATPAPAPSRGTPEADAIGSAATVTAGSAAAPEGEVALAEVGPPAREDEALPGSLRRRYEEIALLGRGGMGAVYRAVDRHLNRVVALKFIYSGADVTAQILREARSQARVEHENACKVYEVGVAEGKPYIVMQLIDGQPFDKAKDQMTLEERVRVIRQVAPALHEAHRLGLVHRDVKPSNIMVEQLEDGSWKPYIMDFGIAREAGEGGHTVTGTIAGTPAFMAPEQARGEIRSLDRRADVYSLGATLYDAIAGRPPFTGQTMWQLLQDVTTKEATPLRKARRDAPEDLEVIVMKCLEKEPHRRYESAKALGEDLQRFLDGDPVRARRVSVGYVLLKKAKKHKAAVALALAALAALAFVIGLAVKARREADERATLARELGEDVKEMELFLRSAYELPLHDIERERDVVRARLRGIEARMAAAGPAGEAAGHYALGRGHLALQEPAAALEHLRKARAAGYASPDLDYALGLSLGELYRGALAETKRIEDSERKKARIAAIEAEYKETALRHLRAALGARLTTPSYVEGLIAFYEEKPEEALRFAREALERAPWLYEVKALEADAHFAIGSRFGHDAAFDYEKMMASYRSAAEAYRLASDAARSDPRIYERECELWTQILNASSSRKEPLTPTFERAKSACSKAIEASSLRAAAHLKLALLYNAFAWWSTSDARAEDAERVFREAIERAEEAGKRSPEDPMARYVVGAVWRTNAFYTLYSGLDARPSISRAIAGYEEALRIDPTFLWALNELCSSHQMRLLDASFRGGDPEASLPEAVRPCDRAITLSPSFLYPYSTKTDLLIHVAEHVGRSGRDPARLLDQAVQVNEALMERSPGWPWSSAMLRRVHLIRATYELGSGADPAASLDKAARRAEEVARLVPSSLEAYVARGSVSAMRALYLLRKSEDPEPALREARGPWQDAIHGRPWDLSFRVARARVEITALRFAVERQRDTEELFAAAFEPLLPLLEVERADPRLYEVMAEIHELQAASLAKSGKDAADAIARGVAMADKALAINPRSAAALSAKAALSRVQSGAR